MIRHNNNNYFIIDTGNNEIIVMDNKFNLIEIINNDFLKKINGMNVEFKTITAITFSKDLIFVSDVGMHAIYAFDFKWKLKFKIEENIYTDYSDVFYKLLNSIKINTDLTIDFNLNSPFDIFYHQKKLFIANTHNDELIILKF